MIHDKRSLCTAETLTNQTSLYRLTAGTVNSIKNTGKNKTFVQIQKRADSCGIF